MSKYIRSHHGNIAAILTIQLVDWQHPLLHIYYFTSSWPSAYFHLINCLLLVQFGCRKALIIPHDTVTTAFGTSPEMITENQSAPILITTHIVIFFNNQSNTIYTPP